MWFRAENDDLLRTYLETSPRNAIYTSKTIQNEMIDVIGSAIEDKIIDKIQAAKFFTILADEVTDCANLEQVSLVIRFADSHKNITEDFLGFITVERITGESLATTLLSWLESHNIDVSRSGIRWSIQYVIQHCRCTRSNTFGVPNGLLYSLSESPVEPLHC